MFALTTSCRCYSPNPQYNLSEEQLDHLFDSINGLFYTGGGLSLKPTTPYYNAAYYLYKKCVQGIGWGGGEGVLTSVKGCFGRPCWSLCT